MKIQHLLEISNETEEARMGKAFDTPADHFQHMKIRYTKALKTLDKISSRTTEQHLAVLQGLANKFEELFHNRDIDAEDYLDEFEILLRKGNFHSLKNGQRWRNRDARNNEGT